MFLAGDWQDYEIIDTGDGMKYERWGGIFLLRPDPQVIWPYFDKPGRVDGYYKRSAQGGGSWHFPGRAPESWTIERNGLKFKIKPMGFKHTGLFPEQAANWDWMCALVRNAGRPVKILNLFGYTGGATAALAQAGAAVTHVDAAKNMVAHGRENLALSGLADRPVRWIVEDCRKFVEREIRRGNSYDGIIMDPPSYGRGPSGQVWKLEEELYPFVSLCMNVLSDNPLFMLINSYTTGLQPLVLYNILSRLFKGRGGGIEAAEVGLPVTRGGIILPCGASGRWQNA